MSTPPRTAVAQVLERLEAELEISLEKGENALFATDADGTLWDGDVGHDLFDALLAERAVRSEAREALAREATEQGLDASGDAQALAERLGEHYRADRYPLDRAFAMMAWIFAGFTGPELDAFSSRVLEAAGLAERVRPGMRRLVERARERGLEVFVVSASVVSAVRAGAAHLGIDADHVVAMTPAIERGVVAPRLGGPVVYGAGKLTALELVAKDRPILAAFGDSAWDAPMLREARLRVLVQPNQGLLDLLPTLEGALIIGAEHG